jgi:Domain of unknown function (DUF5664)
VKKVSEVGAVKVAEVGRKNDAGKDRRPDLLPFRALDEVSKVLAHGAKIYSDDNWHKLPKLRRRYLAASLRHVIDWRLGEKFDKESGLHHLAHFVCDALFVLSAEIGFDPAMDGDDDV